MWNNNYIAYDSFIEKFQEGTEAVRVNKWTEKGLSKLVDTKAKGFEDVDLWPGALLDIAMGMKILQSEIIGTQTSFSTNFGSK